MTGVIASVQSVSIGSAIADLELIAECCEASEWVMRMRGGGLPDTGARNVGQALQRRSQMGATEAQMGWPWLPRMSLTFRLPPTPELALLLRRSTNDRSQQGIYDVPNLILQLCLSRPPQVLAQLGVELLESREQLRSVLGFLTNCRFEKCSHGACSCLWLELRVAFGINDIGV
jgi:hypothetical protein